MISKKDIRIIEDILPVLVIITLFIFSSLFIKQNEQKINELIVQNNTLGIFIYLLILIVSIVFVPVSAIPLMPIASSVWGWFNAAILAVIGWGIGSLIAFLIARRYGRPLIGRLISLEKIDRIGRLVPEKNIFFFIVLLNAIIPFDGVSYVLGLFTYIKTKTFFFATLFGLIPFCLLFSYLGVLPLIYQLIGFVLMFIILFISIMVIEKKQRRKQEMRVK